MGCVFKHNGGHMGLLFTRQQGSAVELLREDHEKIKSLFREFESAGDSDKRRIARNALAELELHAAAEEAVFYPAVLADSSDAKPRLDESREEHHVAKLLISELRTMAAESDRYAAKFRVLAENVKHHIKEEEAELFARARTGKLDLAALGREIVRVKASWRPATTKRSQDKRQTDGSAPVKRSTRSRRMKGKSAKIPTKRAAM